MGRLLTASEGGSSLTYAYDDLGRVTSFTDQAGRTSTYTYDAYGKRIASNYPTGQNFQFTYDASMRLEKIKEGSNELAVYSYDTLGRTTGVALDNGADTSYGYDLLDRLTSVNNALNASARNFTYQYNARDEITGVTEPVGSTFNSQSWTYDAAYNRTSWTVDSTTTTYTVNNLNQYNSVSGKTAPQWSGNGNLTAFDGSIYFYDSKNRLEKVTISGGSVEFEYDPLGRRTKKEVLDGSNNVLETYEYHYDGVHAVVEYQPGKTWTVAYGAGIDEVVMRTDGTAKEFYYRDGLNSVIAVADGSGDLLEAYAYNVQGQIAITDDTGASISTTGIGNDITYTGRRLDQETGNYYYRARYYNPVMGRFISRDPLSAAEFKEGSNLYAYVRNNAANFIDPTGMFLSTKGYVGAVAALAGAAILASGPPGWAAAGAGLLIGGAILTVWDVWDNKDIIDDFEEKFEDMYKDTDGNGMPDIHDPDPNDPNY